jgi:hypothetical protein
MKRRPAIAGEGLRQFRLLVEQTVHLRLVARGCGFKDVERRALGCQACEQKVTHQGLAKVDSP